MGLELSVAAIIATRASTSEVPKYFIQKFQLFQDFCKPSFRNALPDGKTSCKKREIASPSKKFVLQ
jgi:hypothetical protein